jgi:surface protein
MGQQSSIQALEPFEMVIDNTIAGSSGIGSFRIGLPNESSIDNFRFKVDWGDGTISGITTASPSVVSPTHVYPSGGTYTVKIYGKLPWIYFFNDDDGDKVISIESWGNINWKSFNRAFDGSTNLTGITTTTPPVTENLDGSVDTSFNIFFSFRNCPTFNGEVGNWDISKVIGTGTYGTGTEGAFYGATVFNNGGSPSITGWTFNPSLTSFDSMFRDCNNFNQPIGSWDTQYITDMRQVFYNNLVFDQDIGSWDVSNVINLSYLVGGFTAKLFNNGGSPSISGWTTSACTNMRDMFYNCNFNQPIGSWDVSNVENMENILTSCGSFDQDLSNWDVSNVTTFKNGFRGTSFNNSGNTAISGWTVTACTNMEGMFSDTPFNQSIDNWDITNVDGMGYMFASAIAFNQHFDSWDTSTVQSMFSMFDGATAFNQDISHFDFSTINESFSFFSGVWQMFNGATSFNNGGSPNISGWTFPSTVTTFASMFNRAFAFNQPIGSWDTQYITNMSSMFSYTNTFNQDISGWNVSGVTNINSMFNNAALFNQPIGSWDTSSVNTMNGFFAFAGAFDQDLGNWDTSNVTNMSSMFWRCSTFNNGGSPSISGWTTSACTSMQRMFDHFGVVSTFNQPIGSWDVSNVVNMGNMFWHADTFNQDISGWNVSGVTNMIDMLDNTAISLDNYNSILTGWTGWDGTGATKTLQSNVTFGVDGLTYSTGTTADDARNYLLTGLSWTINGDIGV